MEMRSKTLVPRATPQTPPVHQPITDFLQGESLTLVDDGIETMLSPMGSRERSGSASAPKVIVDLPRLRSQNRPYMEDIGTDDDGDDILMTHGKTK